MWERDVVMRGGDVEASNLWEIFCAQCSRVYQSFQLLECSWIVRGENCA